MSAPARSAAELLDLLSRLSGTLHIYHGRASGVLHISRPWAHVKFRQGKGETLEQTLNRAIDELHRRAREGMPRTTQTAPCSACGGTSKLRYLQSAKAWLCDDCRRGLRQMANERRRAKQRGRTIG